MLGYKTIEFLAVNENDSAELDQKHHARTIDTQYRNDSGKWGLLEASCHATMMQKKHQTAVENNNFCA